MKKYYWGGMEMSKSMFDKYTKGKPVLSKEMYDDGHGNKGMKYILMDCTTAIVLDEWEGKEDKR